jgi:hypothetical protein
MYELMLGALLLLTVAWLVVWVRQNKAADKAAMTPTTAADTGKYHAVAIKYSDKACDAANSMTGRRFLSTAAPRLPLPDCDSLECRCTFEHFKDRRSSDRRSSFSAGRATGTTGNFEKERREKTDRRKDGDLHNW